MNPGMPKLIISFNGPLCAYLTRQNLHIGLVQDFRAMNVLATFQNDTWKFTDMRAQTVIFHVRSWKMRKFFFFFCSLKLTRRPGNHNCPINKQHTDCVRYWYAMQYGKISHQLFLCIASTWSTSKSKISVNLLFFWSGFVPSHAGQICFHLLPPQ